MDHTYMINSLYDCAGAAACCCAWAWTRLIVLQRIFTVQPLVVCIFPEFLKSLELYLTGITKGSMGQRINIWNYKTMLNTKTEMVKTPDALPNTVPQIIETYFATAPQLKTRCKKLNVGSDVWETGWKVDKSFTDLTPAQLCPPLWAPPHHSFF